MFEKRLNVQKRPNVQKKITITLGLGNFFSTLRKVRPK